MLPCPTCDRHVRLDAGACPFCGGSLAPTSSSVSKVGALLLGAAALTSLSGCPRPAAKYGGPPVPQQRAAEPTPAASETSKPPPSDASADAGDLQAESGTPSPGR